jgi:hypothetical protein
VSPDFDSTGSPFCPERIFKGPGFAETLFLGALGGRRIIRKASNPDALPFSRTALVREIRLLLGLPDELRPLFPEVLGTNLGGKDEEAADLPPIIHYDMPYYAPEEGWTSLSRFLFGEAVDGGEARRVLGEILDAAFRYFRIDERTPDPGYAERSMLAAIRESIAFTESDPALGGLAALAHPVVSGRRVRGAGGLAEYLADTPRLRALLTPSRDRFLHGDFFPENILYNLRTGRWLLLDPVSVRGVHRGDFMLDTVKMGEWLSGELPAFRMGRFTCDIRGDEVAFALHTDEGELAALRRMGLGEWYRERLRSPEYADVFACETGWEARESFVKAFYAFSMVPLADRHQAAARLVRALVMMDEFIARAGKG